MIETAGRFHSKATDHVVAGANEILDDNLQKKQSEINAENESFKEAQAELNEGQSDFNSEVREALGTGGTVDERIVNAVNTEKTRAEAAEEALGGRVDTLENAVGTGGSVDERIAEEGAKHYLKEETYNKTELNNMITTPNQEYVSVTATAQTTAVTDVLPATGAADTTYRVGNWNGTQYNDSVFSEYAWNGSAYIKLSTKSQVGEVYDISANHADTKYADLAAALGTNGANIPQSLRKGGMSVKFVQSSDNKYVQARCMAQNFTTDVTQWQGVDDEPVAGSDNLVKSGGVFDFSGIKYNSDTGYNSNFTIPIEIGFTKGTVAEFKVDGSSVISGYYFYLKYEGDDSFTNIGHYTTFDSWVPVNINKNVVAVRIYTDIYQVYGTVTLFVRESFKASIDLTNERQASTERNSLIDNLSFTQGFSYVANTDVGNSFSFGMPDGYIGLAIYSEGISKVNLYVKYDGDENFTNVFPDSAPNIKHILKLSKPIIALQFYILGSEITLSGDGQFVVTNETLRVATDKLDDFTNSKSIHSTASTPVEVNEGKIECPAKSGELIKFKINDPNNCVPNIGAFYYIDTNGTRIALFSGENNKEYSWRATTDIDYLTIYVASASVTGYFTFEVDVLKGLESRTEVLESIVVDGNFIKTKEKIDVESRFLPYSITTEEEGTAAYPTKHWEKCCNLLLTTDSHVDDEFAGQADIENVKESVDFANSALYKIYDRTPNVNSGRIFDVVMNGGDAISSGYKETSESCEAKAAPYFNAIKNLELPFIFSLGNHDMLLSDTFISDSYGDWASQKFGLVRQTKANGHKSIWCYQDIPSKKVRIISIDCQDVDTSVLGQDGYPLYNGGNAWNIAQEQMTWLVNIALNFDDKTEKDWGVVILAHQSIRINFNPQVWYLCDVAPAFEGNLPKFFEVLKAFNSQGTYTYNYTFAEDSFYNMSINADYTRYASLDKKPHVICWLNGHEHVDYYKQIDGINFIWTLNQACMMAYSTPKVLRSEKTQKQNAFDCISIDTLHRKIRFIRFGAGKDCFGEGGDRFLPEGLSY